MEKKIKIEITKFELHQILDAIETQFYCELPKEIEKEFQELHDKLLIYLGE